MNSEDVSSPKIKVLTARKIPPEKLGVASKNLSPLLFEFNKKEYS